MNIFGLIFSGRRYKILNPERMRDSYGKLMYFLQESGVDCLVRVTHVANCLLQDWWGQTCEETDFRTKNNMFFFSNGPRINHDSHEQEFFVVVSSSLLLI